MFDSYREVRWGRGATKSIALVLAISIVSPSMLVALPGDAQAQPKRPKSVRDLLDGEARKSWDTAVNLANHGQWDAARSAFLQAYELSRNPRVLFNVGVAEKNNQRFAQAIDTFRRELAEGRGLLAPDEEAEINAAIASLEKYVMAVTINVSEPGAHVFVDDTEVGISPLKGPVTVSLGSHRIRATKPGMADAQARVEGVKKDESVNLKLEANIRSARVNIAVVGPKVAVIKVDGREVGSATPTTPYSGVVEARQDPHEFSAEAPDFVTAKVSAVVRENEPLSLTLQLSTEQRKGRLLVSAIPEGATIDIDDKPVGATKWEGTVDAGKHQIVVKKQGFYTWSYDVDVPRGAERSVSARLNEDRNTSFVPWLIGTVLIAGAATTALYFILRPKDQEPVQGSLPPHTVDTPAVRF